MNPLAPNRQPRSVTASRRIPVKPRRGQNREWEATPAARRPNPPDCSSFRSSPRQPGPSPKTISRVDTFGLGVPSPAYTGVCTARLRRLRYRSFGRAVRRSASFGGRGNPSPATAGRAARRIYPLWGVALLGDNWSGRGTGKDRRRTQPYRHRPNDARGAAAAFSGGHDVVADRGVGDDPVQLDAMMANGGQPHAVSAMRQGTGSGLTRCMTK